MTYDQNGVLLDQTEAGNIPLKYSSITLPSTAVTLTSGNGAVAGQYTYLDVTIDIESPVPQGGKVEIMFPKWSYGVLGAPSEQSMIGDFTTSCIVLNTSNGSCEIDEPSNSSGGKDTLRVVNGFVSGDQSSSFTVRLTNIRNPPTLQPRTGFIVNTMITLDEVNHYVNTCSGITLTLSSSYEQTSVAGSSVVLSGNTAPGRDGSYEMTFETTLPIPLNGAMHITIPNEVFILSSGVSSIQVLDGVNVSSTVSLLQGSSSKVIILQNGFA